MRNHHFPFVSHRLLCGFGVASALNLGPELWNDANAVVSGAQTSSIIGGGRFRISTTDGSYTAIKMNGVSLDVSKTYRVSYTVESVTSGGVRMGNTGVIRQDVGTYSEDFQNNQAELNIKRAAAEATDVTISDVSVREIL